MERYRARGALTTATITASWIARTPQFRHSGASVMRLRDLAPVTIASLLVSSAGCADVLDYDAISFGQTVPPFQGVTSSLTCGAVPVPSGDCAACLDAACCVEGQACAQNGACSSLALCRLRCAPNDLECLHACGVDYFDGINAWKALNGCESVSCGDACATSCGIEWADPVCNECVQTMCFESCGTCASNPACVALLQCVVACSDDACQGACADAHPSGLDALVGFMGQGGCLETRCAGAC